MAITRGLRNSIKAGKAHLREEQTHIKTFKNYQTVSKNGVYRRYSELFIRENKNDFSVRLKIKGGDSNTIYYNETEKFKTIEEAETKFNELKDRLKYAENNNILLDDAVSILSEDYGVVTRGISNTRGIGSTSTSGTGK